MNLEAFRHVLLRQPRRSSSVPEIGPLDVVHGRNVTTFATFVKRSCATYCDLAECQRCDSCDGMHHWRVFSHRVSGVRTPAQRGPVGNWLRDERLSRGWKQETARANLARAGISIPASVYAEFESGTRVPSEERIQAIAAYYGSSPAESPAEATPAGLSDLIATLVTAFETQAHAIMSLTEEIRQSRRDEYADLLARMRKLEATVQTFHPPEEVAESEGLHPPQRRGG